MGALALSARLVLAALFALAAVAKLADLSGSRAAMEGFGAPAPVARVSGTLLPLGELVIAAALVPPRTAGWAALGALALLLSFIGAILRGLTRGESPDCHCLGQLHSSPAGWGTLARNALLAVLAVLALVG